MQKLLHFDSDDLVVDRESVLEQVQRSCQRNSGRFRVRGVCQVDRLVTFVLDPIDAGESLETYEFGWLDDITAEGVESAILNRWSAGRDTVGSVSLGDDRYLLLLASRPE